MGIYNFINKIQTFMSPVYEKSCILQNIDFLIGLNIFLLIVSSTFATSDFIGYFALFTILLTTIKLFTKKCKIYELNLEDKLLLAYFMFVIISVAGSSLFLLSLKGFFKTLTYLGFYVSVVQYLKDNRDKIKWIFIAFCLCACYETIFAFLQNFSAVEEISGWQDMSNLNPEEVMTRVYGTLHPFNPNLFGGYMLSIIPAFITLPFINKKLLPVALITGILSVTAMVLTGCRGAYIGFFFMLITLVCITYKLLQPKMQKIFTAIVGLGVLITSLIIVSTASLRARIFSIFAMRSDSSNSFRFNVYQSCIQMFKDNWLLGIGCGNQNFREIYGLYMKTGFDALSAYNIYLETAVESGIFALITFVTFIGINIYKALKYVYKTPSPLEGEGRCEGLKNSVFVLAAFLSLVGILTHGMVDTVFFRPQIQFNFWIMVGIIRVITNNK